MDAVVGQFTFTANAKTRDECISKMDWLSFQFLELVGGAPWVMTDDDIKRIHMPMWAMKDSDDYAYVGVRSYSFNGPVMAGPGVLTHDNFKVQHGVQED
jgi:hypothetical protein